MAYTGLLKDYQQSGLASARPTNPSTTPGTSPGTMVEYYATDTGVFSVWDGSAWHSIGGGTGIAVQDEGTPLGTATTMNFVGSGVTTTFGSGTATVTIPGGGGGGGSWALLNSWSFAVSGAISTLDTTGITSQEVLIVGSSVTMSGASESGALMSTNNGVSYFNGGTDYQKMSYGDGSTGNLAFFYLANTIGGGGKQSFIGRASCLNLTAPKPLENSAYDSSIFVGSTAPVNAIRVRPVQAATTFNGGAIYIFGR